MFPDDKRSEAGAGDLVGLRLCPPLCYSWLLEGRARLTRARCQLAISFCPCRCCKGLSGSPPPPKEASQTRDDLNLPDRDPGEGLAAEIALITSSLGTQTVFRFPCGRFPLRGKFSVLESSLPC